MLKYNSNDEDILFILHICLLRRIELGETIRVNASIANLPLNLIYPNPDHACSSLIYFSLSI